VKVKPSSTLKITPARPHNPFSSSSARHAMAVAGDGTCDRLESRPTQRHVVRTRNTCSAISEIASHARKLTPSTTDPCVPIHRRRHTGDASAVGGGTARQGVAPWTTLRRESRAYRTPTINTIVPRVALEPAPHRPPHPGERSHWTARAHRVGCRVAHGRIPTNGGALGPGASDASRSLARNPLQVEPIAVAHKLTPPCPHSPTNVPSSVRASFTHSVGVRRTAHAVKAGVASIRRTRRAYRQQRVLKIASRALVRAFAIPSPHKRALNTGRRLTRDTNGISRRRAWTSQHTRRTPRRRAPDTVSAAQIAAAVAGEVTASGPGKAPSRPTLTRHTSSVARRIARPQLRPSGTGR
jgi:hypothetical protein